MSIDQPEPGGRRILPDFLKSGDPALTFPHGKAYGVNHPNGVPNRPGPITAEELARDWLAHVAAGRIGPPPASAHPEPVEGSP